jgi:hypothetical protein
MILLVSVRTIVKIIVCVNNLISLSIQTEWVIIIKLSGYPYRENLRKKVRKKVRKEVKKKVRKSLSLRSFLSCGGPTSQIHNYS